MDSARIKTSKKKKSNPEKSCLVRTTVQPCRDLADLEPFRFETKVFHQVHEKAERLNLKDGCFHFTTRSRPYKASSADSYRQQLGIRTIQKQARLFILTQNLQTKSVSPLFRDPVLTSDDYSPNQRIPSLQSTVFSAAMETECHRNMTLDKPKLVIWHFGRERYRETADILSSLILLFLGHDLRLLIF